PLPDTIPVLIFWWAWRYRSELAPLYLATATAFLAWMLHLTHPQWWPAILAVAVLAGCGLAVTGHRFGLPTRIDCLYAELSREWPPSGRWRAIPYRRLTRSPR
ncbi:MAG: hypothetical protein M3460_27815, partial [Actinomycetota bacterium]|nr:hypothetical protein [Actinomycetota bacterium]